MVGLMVLLAVPSTFFWLSGLLTRRLPLPSGIKIVLRISMVACAFPLLVVDEIIGKHQFDVLCKANKATETASISSAQGMSVKYQRKIIRRIQT